MSNLFNFDPPPSLIEELDIAKESVEADPTVEGSNLLPPSLPLPEFRYVCGRAGTGKTFWAKNQIKDDPSWGLLCATTGIAAVNLDAITLNSALKYFDTDSLRDSYLNGRLARSLHDIALSYRRLVIDEVSMMDKVQLQLIRRALDDANSYKDITHPLGITLVGDFAQLPPVRAAWAFEADCWEEFRSNTLRLDKVWRQDEAVFLDALNAARSGDGARSAELLTSAGIEWHSALDTEFEGTTIIPKNDAVDRYNWMALDKHRGKKITVASRRWGKTRNEWKNIPLTLEMKEGAYVMILANSPSSMSEDGFEYVNGDCGFVTGFDGDKFQVELVRNHNTVSIGRLVRGVDESDEPKGWNGPRITKGEDTGAYIPRPHYRVTKKKFVQGQVEYYPLRLAYATSVHKSQGVSLDSLQIDFRDPFFGCPGMIYVALSRCRTLAGLRLVGQRERFVQRCNMDSRIKEYI